MKKALNQAVLCFVCLWPGFMVQADDSKTPVTEQQPAEQAAPAVKPRLTAEDIDSMITVEREKYWSVWRRLQKEKSKGARVHKQLPELRAEYSESVRQLKNCLDELELPYDEFVIDRGTYSRAEFESAVQQEVGRVITLKATLMSVERSAATYDTAIRELESQMRKAEIRLKELIREVRRRLVERELAELALGLAAFTSELVEDDSSPLVAASEQLGSDKDEAYQKAEMSPHVAFPLDQVGRDRGGNFTKTQAARLINAGVQIPVNTVDNTPAGQ